jgi:hypothetical protein
MLPLSQPPDDEMGPVTPNSAAAVESLAMSLSRDVEVLNAGYMATTTRAYTAVPAQ